MSCLLCRRRAERDALCRYHLDARDELKKGYRRWRDAYTGMSWREYLDRIKRLDATGLWVKEVADLMERQDND